MKCNTCTFNIYWKVWIEISKSRLMTWSDQNPKSWHLKSQISSSIENLFQSKPIKVSRVEFQSGSWLFVGLSADKKDNSCRQYILGEEYRGMLKPLTPIIVAKFGRKNWFDFTIYCENLIAFCPKSCGSLLKIRKLLGSTIRILLDCWNQPSLEKYFLLWKISNKHLFFHQFSQLCKAGSETITHLVWHRGICPR